MKANEIIKKQAELINVQGMFISYFKKYAGDSERINQFSKTITTLREEITSLTEQVDDNDAGRVRDNDIVWYFIERPQYAHTEGIWLGITDAGFKWTNNPTRVLKDSNRESLQRTVEMFQKPNYNILGKDVFISEHQYINPETEYSHISEQVDCNLYKKTCIGNLCSVTPNPEKCKCLEKIIVEKEKPSGEYFEKVVIKSPADYPKIMGDYFCSRNGFESVQMLIADNGEETYMREVRWYLRPLSSAPHDVTDDFKMVYAAMYNHMIYESDFSIISLHWTLREAEMAMEFHKAEEKKEYEESYKDDPEHLKEYHFDDYKAWRVEEFSIKGRCPLSSAPLDVTEKNFRQAFEAGRSWQIAETSEYNGGDENERPDFKQWFSDRMKQTKT